MSNLLAMPLVNLTVITGTNEDWIDSILFLVDDGAGGDPADLPQLDLTGIAFSMEVRRNEEDHEVVVRGSTTDGTLAVGEPPNVGYLLINIDHEEMKVLRPGDYVADIVGVDGPTIRRVCTIDLEVVIGVTRP